MRWEGKTMQSGTSFYNSALGRQLTLRFWPLWALYTVIWAIALPVSGIMSLRQGWLDNWAAQVGQLCRGMGLLMAVLFGCMAAMAVCSHLYSVRSANFTAALPPRRTTQFLTHYLTGLAFLVVPVLVLAVPTALLVATAYTGYLGSTLAPGLVLVLLECLFFYSFAFLCGMLTGHILALPAFYLIFNGLAFLLWTLAIAILAEFYYGFPIHGGRIPDWLVWLCPVYCIEIMDPFSSEGMARLAVYGVVGVVMAAGSWLLYRCRRMETAGDVIAWRGLRPVFLYSVSLCAGLTLGMLTRVTLGLGEQGLAVSVLLWGLAGYFVARMLLTKSVRVLRYWKGAGVMAVVFVILFAVVKLDPTGYVARVPDPQDVAWVEVEGIQSEPFDGASYLEGNLSDPAVVELITQMHRLHLEQPDGIQYGFNMELTYHMENGRTMTRYYTIYLEPADLERPDTVTYVANRLVNHPQALRTAYGLDQLDRLEQELGARMIGAYWGDQTLDAGTAQDLLRAMERDLEAGNLPRSLFDMGEADPTVQLLWQWRDPETNGTRSWEIEVAVPDTAANLLAVLDQLS